MNGTVKFYNVAKKFGFVSGEDGKDYFVHESELKEGTRLNEGDSITFDGEEGDRGLKAVNVSKGDAPAQSSEQEDEVYEESDEDEDSEESSDDSDDSDDSEESSEDSEEKKE